MDEQIKNENVIENITQNETIKKEIKEENTESEFQEHLFELKSKSWVNMFKEWFGIYQTTTLVKCLAGFCGTELLKEKEGFFCEHCKTSRKALKSFSIETLPEVLCIHLKRFNYSYYGTKLSNVVEFPLCDLDLSPFCSSISTRSNSTTSSSNSFLYDLFAVVCHSGGYSSGHYIAYALWNQNSNKIWYEFDDIRVRECRPEEVEEKTSQAYILFYQLQSSKLKQEVQKQIKNLKNQKEQKGECFISKLWMKKWKTQNRPGPISNSDVWCTSKSEIKKKDKNNNNNNNNDLSFSFNNFNWSSNANHRFSLPPLKKGFDLDEEQEIQLKVSRNKVKLLSLQVYQCLQTYYGGESPISISKTPFCDCCDSSSF